ncbi:uncharacterized protein LOC132611892 [Lycium barbarum]|uniref:uncharacterized protein LOC132611892 n=1 Tax=Lycium barbarum TaxID=112863 RepID=UPI00293E8D13|nr:uncharacterized protein LOC132611892 [Lycium barbarum]
MGEKLMPMGAWESWRDASSMWDRMASCIRETTRDVLGVSRGHCGRRRGDWWWNEKVQGKVEAKKGAYARLVDCKDEEEKQTNRERKGLRLKNVQRNKDLTSSLSGQNYTLELLSGSSRQCLELMRMSRDAYVQLCQYFRHNGWLTDSKYVYVEEKITIFLSIIGHNECSVVIKRRFQHSSQTIHKYFHEVLEAMMKFAKEMISSTTSDPNLDTPGAHKRLRKIFKNVLGICDFNMVFTYVYAGWEGVAHDAHLTEIVSNPENGFPFPPPNKYYLCDAAYPNTRGFPAPYRNVRYWLGDYQRRRAINKEEKFNHAHSQLRNVIERAYGVLKARFPILDKMPPYSIDIQRDVVVACFAVHKFIRKERINDELFNQYDSPQLIFDEEEGEQEDMLDEASGPNWTAEDSQIMHNMHEQLTLQLMQRRGNT